MKRCSDCETTKPFEEFSPQHRMRDGYRNQCKACCAAKRKAKYWADPEAARLARRAGYWQNVEREREYAREYAANYRRDRPDRVRQTKAAQRPKQAMNESRRRARIAGNQTETFSIDDVLARYGSDCHLCGGPIDLAAPRTTKDYHPNALHLDHAIATVNGGAHTLENVRPAHARCNLRKGGA